MGITSSEFAAYSDGSNISKKYDSNTAYVEFE